MYLQMAGRERIMKKQSKSKKIDNIRQERITRIHSSRLSFLFFFAFFQDLSTNNSHINGSSNKNKTKRVLLIRFYSSFIT